MSSVSRFCRLFATLSFALLSVPIPAQPTYFPIEGYINVVHSPSVFEVDGRRFVVTPQTAFGPMGGGATSIPGSLRQTLRIGSYVQVEGDDPGTFKPIIATTVLVRDEWNQKLSGIGVITRILSPAPAPVFEADGYFIRITPATKLVFQDGLSSLADISANTWLLFSGKLGKDGVLEAAKVRFMPPKPTKFKAVKDLEVPAVKTRPAGAPDATTTSEATGTPAITGDGASLQQDEELKIGLGRWHTLPADQPLQQRVHRIGMALVPAYQRDLADDDSSKIHFRFFAVDNNKLRNAACLLDGAILVSKQTIERLSSDDQLAAVVADGIACNLQRQAARRLVAMRKEIAFAVADAFFPEVGLAAMFVPGASTSNQNANMGEERLRMALALMSDAGYDPWQAPEAWLLLAPKKLPANLASLKYPDSSCYQFEILNSQYPKTKAANGPAGTRQAGEAAEGK